MCITEAHCFALSRHAEELNNLSTASGRSASEQCEVSYFNLYVNNIKDTSKQTNDSDESSVELEDDE